MKHWIGFLALLLSVVVLGACFPQGKSMEAESESAADESWAKTLLAERQEKDEELSTSSTSPMAGIIYLKSKPGAHVYLTRDEAAFALAEEADPSAILRVALQDGLWHWYAEGEKAECEAEDEAMPSGSVLPGPATFEVDRFTLSFYPSDEQVTFIVYDPEREELGSFQHLLYYAPDEKYAVDARLERIPEPDEITMLTSRNLEKTFYRYALIHFQVDGTDQQLTALKSELEGPGSTALFIPFRDATSGIDTYGAGRFLDIEEPDDTHLVLDFNRAYNPLCNYSPAFNCALPPRENHLSVAIEAGEMTYPH